MKDEELSKEKQGSRTLLRTNMKALVGVAELACWRNSRLHVPGNLMVDIVAYLSSISSRYLTPFFIAPQFFSGPSSYPMKPCAREKLT